MRNTGSRFLLQLTARYSCADPEGVPIYEKKIYEERNKKKRICIVGIEKKGREALAYGV